MITPFSTGAWQASGLNGWDDWQRVQTPGFVDIPTVDEMVRCTSTAYSIFPNLITPVDATGFPFIVFWPLDRRTTRIDWIHYAPIAFDPADGLPPQWEQRLARFDAIMQEDFANMAPMQRSLESPGLRGIPINYQERRIWHFNEQVDRMIGIERIPPELRVAQLLGGYVGE
jgi:hypothetical protein